MRGVLGEISDAIRAAMYPGGRTLRDLPDDVLIDLAVTLTAFCRDAGAEVQRRSPAVAREVRRRVSL